MSNLGLKAAGTTQGVNKLKANLILKLSVRRQKIYAPCMNLCQCGRQKTEKLGGRDLRVPQ